jgi:hypothetical protein
VKASFELKDIRNNSLWNLFRMRDRIEMNPTYQREGGVWTKDKQRLLIDTILNGFDVPKLYLHQFLTPENAPSGRSIEYAVIDGKQRLEAIWKFLEGGIAVGGDTEYIRDPSIQLAEKTYQQIAKEYPDIRADFDAFKLDVVVIETDDIELIEDMFSRLNEAVPLNASEKRNALPGPLPRAVRRLSQTDLFTKKVPFPNNRYRHYDVAAKMLYFAARDGIADTKKAYIDRFFRDHAKVSWEDFEPTYNSTIVVTDAMAAVFTDKDPLLASVGMLTIYYVMFARAIERGLLEEITRTALIDFENRRRINRQTAQEEIADADYLMLEFDRFAQSPNDGFANRFRLAVIDHEIFEGRLGFELELPDRTDDD